MSNDDDATIQDAIATIRGSDGDIHDYASYGRILCEGGVDISAWEREMSKENGSLAFEKTEDNGRSEVVPRAFDGNVSIGNSMTPCWSKAATESIPQDVRDEIRGITQSHINYYRAKVGLPPLESKHRTLAEMARGGHGLFANRDLVNTIVDAVSKKTSVLSEEETFAIRDLEKETAENYQVKVEEANKAMNRGNKADEIRLRAEADAIQEVKDKYDAIMGATLATAKQHLDGAGKMPLAERWRSHEFHSTHGIRCMLHDFANIMFAFFRNAMPHNANFFNGCHVLIHFGPPCSSCRGMFLAS